MKGSWNSPSVRSATFPSMLSTTRPLTFEHLSAAAPTWPHYRFYDFLKGAPPHSFHCFPCWDSWPLLLTLRELEGPHSCQLSGTTSLPRRPREAASQHRAPSYCSNAPTQNMHAFWGQLGSPAISQLLNHPLDYAKIPAPSLATAPSPQVLPSLRSSQRQDTCYPLIATTD